MNAIQAYSDCIQIDFGDRAGSQPGKSVNFRKVTSGTKLRPVPAINLRQRNELFGVSASQFDEAMNACCDSAEQLAVAAMMIDHIASYVRSINLAGQPKSLPPAA